MCAFVWFSEIQAFICFLCACVANDAGHEATGDPLQDLDAKQLVMYIRRRLCTQCMHRMWNRKMHESNHVHILGFYIVASLKI